MWLIAGLGNPGVKYRFNRHNIGFCVLDLLSEEAGIPLKRSTRFHASLGKGLLEGEEVVLVEPLTYMNLSGRAVREAHNFYSVPLNKTIIVSDDIDLPWGKIRIRKQGSSGGHNGLESIIQELGTPNFARIRMGVGRPIVSDNNVVGHVLSDFSLSEKRELGEYCKTACNAVLSIITEGIEKTMNLYN